MMMCMRAAVLEYLLDPGGHQCHKPHATAQVPNYLPLPKCKKTSQIKFERAGVSKTEKVSDDTELITLFNGITSQSCSTFLSNITFTSLFSKSSERVSFLTFVSHLLESLRATRAILKTRLLSPPCPASAPDG